MTKKKVRSLNVPNMVFSQNPGCLFFEDECARNSIFLDFGGFGDLGYFIGFKASWDFLR